ncbi:hypothetical protein GGS20DRAFT_583677 [Poronia punctata]|nr:hypothetical protein GGS20DRAFT_583677 [Poronia punctata]
MGDNDNVHSDHNTGGDGDRSEKTMRNDPLYKEQLAKLRRDGIQPNGRVGLFCTLTLDMVTIHYQDGVSVGMTLKDGNQVSKNTIIYHPSLGVMAQADSSKEAALQFHDIFSALHEVEPDSKIFIRAAIVPDSVIQSREPACDQSGPQGEAQQNDAAPENAAENTTPARREAAHYTDALSKADAVVVLVVDHMTVVINGNHDNQVMLSMATWTNTLTQVDYHVNPHFSKT